MLGASEVLGPCSDRRREERIKRRSQGGFEENALGFPIPSLPSSPTSPVELLERAVVSEVK
jgi:hypothetical protein